MEKSESINERIIRQARALRMGALADGLEDYLSFAAIEKIIPLVGQATASYLAYSLTVPASVRVMVFSATTSPPSVSLQPRKV